MTRINPALGDRLPFWHFDGDYAVFNDGSLGAGFKLTGIDISCAGEEKVNEVTRALENLVNTAKEGLQFQIFYQLGDNVDGLIEEHKKSTNSSDKNYQEIHRSRVQFLNDEKSVGNFVKPEVYFFLRGQPYKYKKKKFWEPPKQFEQISHEDYQRHRSKFDRAVTHAKSSLQSIGLEPEIVSSEAWFSLLFEYLNASRFKKLGAPSFRADGSPFDASLADQLVLSETLVHKDHIENDGLLFRVVTLKTLPEGFSFPAMIENLLALPFHFWMSQSTEVLNQKKEVERLQLSRRLTHSMASGATNVSDLESESKLGHIEDLIKELLEGSEKVVATDLNVIVWASDIEKLEEKTDEVLKAFKNLNQAEAISESLAGIDAFIKAMPGACDGLRKKKVKTSNACHFMPVFGSWKGNRRPICILPNRSGVPTPVDPFAPELPAWNGLIFGSTGSGKSYVVQQLAMNLYGMSFKGGKKPKIIWIDNGASSQRLLEALDGEFIDLNINSSIHLNPFELGPGEKEPTPGKIKLLLGILELICKEDDQKGLPKRDKALLEAAIFKVYETVKERTPTLSDLKKILAKHSVPSMKAYAEILFSWTGNTAYGRLLDRQSNVTLSKNLVTVETKGLDDYPDLQNVFLLLFTDFIKTEAARDPSAPTLLILDEAWRLFATPSSRDFAIESYRTFRKFNAGCWSISQNYRDFLADPEIRNALLPNTTSIFILKQRGVDWEEFRTILGLNEAQCEAAKSLQMVKGEFSELLYIQDQNVVILRVIADRLSYLLASSDPKDKELIAEMRKELGLETESIIEVLKQIIANEEQAA